MYRERDDVCICIHTYGIDRERYVIDIHMCVYVYMYVYTYMCYVCTCVLCSCNMSIHSCSMLRCRRAGPTMKAMWPAAGVARR